MVQEFIEDDRDRKFPLCTGYVNSQYTTLFQNSALFRENLPDDEPVYKNKKDNTTEVSWVDAYRDDVGRIDWFIKEWLKLGNPEEVRIFFSFTK